MLHGVVLGSAILTAPLALASVLVGACAPICVLPLLSVAAQVWLLRGRWPAWRRRGPFPATRWLGALPPVSLSALLWLGLDAWARRGDRAVATLDDDLPAAGLRIWRVIAPDQQWPELRVRHESTADSELRTRLEAAHREPTGRGLHDS